MSGVEWREPSAADLSANASVQAAAALDKCVLWVGEDSHAEDPEDWWWCVLIDGEEAASGSGAGGIESAKIAAVAVGRAVKPIQDAIEAAGTLAVKFGGLWLGGGL